MVERLCCKESLDCQIRVAFEEGLCDRSAHLHPSDGNYPFRSRSFKVPSVTFESYIVPSQPDLCILRRIEGIEFIHALQVLRRKSIVLLQRLEEYDCLRTTELVQIRSFELFQAIRSRTGFTSTFPSLGEGVRCVR